MPAMHFFIVVGHLLVLTQWVASAQRVVARDGSIYLTTQDGTVRRLTNSGKDSAPALSGDRRLLVYVRSYPIDERGSGSASEIRIRDLYSDHDHPVLRGPIVLDGDRYLTFCCPQFSADATGIYFLFDWSVTTKGLAYVPIKSPNQVRFVMPALNYSVVNSGKYKGDLVVRQRRSKLSGGYFYLYYLYTPEGKEVGIVGENEFDVGLFLNPE